MNVLKQCPVCDSCRIYTEFNKEGYNYCKCKRCGFIFVNPRPDMEELKEIYDENFYKSGAAHKYKELNASLDYAAEQQLKLVKSVVKPFAGHTLLDIGCGKGHFLKLVNRGSYNGMGIDISAESFETCKAEGIPIVLTTIEEFKNDLKFRAITAFDLVEHISDLDSFTAAVQNKLYPYGYFIFKVPNVNAFRFKQLNKPHIGFMAPVHLNYFSNATVRFFLETHGLEAVSVYSEPSITLGIRRNLLKIARKLNNPVITSVVDYLEKGICLFKRDIFYPIINRIYRITGWDANSITVIARKKG